MLDVRRGEVDWGGSDSVDVDLTHEPFLGLSLVAW
jgi:hypothetical protein